MSDPVTPRVPPTRREWIAGAAALGAGLAFIRPAGAQTPALLETPSLAERVAAGKLPPIGMRVPQDPLVVDLAGRGRTPGRHGGEVRTLVGRVRDLRFITVNGYTRVVGYDEKLNLVPDLALAVDSEDERVFTIRLRAGHRWSDGHPFTAEDFRYAFEDVISNAELSPVGLPPALMANGKGPRFSVIDERTVRYEWDAPNPRFLPMLAQPRPVFIYSPAHYLRGLHARYTDRKALDLRAAREKLRGWAALHNRLDDPYENSNPEMPSLNPWVVVTAAPANRFVFERNPFYHRLDPQGRQLPYVDRVLVDVSAGGLMAAKSNAGEVDLMTRGLSMADIPVLKQGEKSRGYRTLLWRQARGSAYALYPNLTVKDPVWRATLRDVRVRRALSLAIDRRILNNALLFGRGVPGNNTVIPGSAYDDPAVRTLWAGYEPARANALLDEAGLNKRNGEGTRLLADGRPFEVIVEVDGESSDVIDALQLVTEFWRDVGVKLFPKPQERTVLRNRSFAGLTVMVAAGGFEMGLPTALTPPTELAPLVQVHWTWPKWGQWAENHGARGEKPDLPEAIERLRLHDAWMGTRDTAERGRIWRAMLRLHAEQQFTIGTVAGDVQPVVVAASLRNVPKSADFSWEPTALLGVYRVDEFFFDNGAGTGTGTGARS